MLNRIRKWLTRRKRRRMLKRVLTRSMRAGAMISLGDAWIFKISTDELEGILNEIIKENSKEFRWI